MGTDLSPMWFEWWRYPTSRGKWARAVDSPGCGPLHAGGMVSSWFSWRILLMPGRHADVLSRTRWRPRGHGWSKFHA